MKQTPLILIATLFAYAVNGQAPANAKEEMQKLRLWPGHWTGTSVWSMRGKDEQSTVEENIEWRVEGYALLLNGIGKDAGGNVVHEALGVLSYNAREAKFHLNSWLKDGRSTDAWFNVVSENRFQWGFETPQGKIRYNIVLTEKSWKETGEFSSDGTQWFQFFNMDLARSSE